MTSFWTDVPGDPLVDPVTGAPLLDPITHLPLYGPPIPAPPLLDPDAVRPDVDDVAKLERTRCVDQGGTDQGTFTDSTHPTAAEAEDVIDQALFDVLAQLPPHLDSIWWPAIERVVALHAAILIEGSYFRETAASGPAGQYAQQFTTDLQALRSLVPRATFLA